MPTAPATLALDDALVLDARRAAYLPGPRAVVVADTHFGHAWVERARGSLVPVNTPDDSAARLAALVRDHAARQLVVLGDVVHAALDVPGLRGLLAEVASIAPDGTRFVLGNHDRRLAERLRAWGIAAECADRVSFPGFELVHGDRDPGPASPGIRRLSGHEHPAVVLGDGVATAAKVPAFVVGGTGVVLPAFSDWAAGCVVGGGRFLGPVASAMRVESLVACLGPRLLRLPAHLLGAGQAVRR